MTEKEEKKQRNTLTVNAEKWHMCVSKRAIEQ